MARFCCVRAWALRPLSCWPPVGRVAILPRQGKRDHRSDRPAVCVCRLGPPRSQRPRPDAACSLSGRWSQLVAGRGDLRSNWCRPTDHRQRRVGCAQWRCVCPLYRTRASARAIQRDPSVISHVIRSLDKGLSWSAPVRIADLLSVGTRLPLQPSDNGARWRGPRHVCDKSGDRHLVCGLAGFAVQRRFARLDRVRSIAGCRCHLERSGAHQWRPVGACVHTDARGTAGRRDRGRLLRFSPSGLGQSSSPPSSGWRPHAMASRGVKRGLPATSTC